MSATAFTLVCGDDDFLVAQEAGALYEEKTRDITDDFEREVIDGAVMNLKEAEASLKNFRSAVQNLSLFGGRKVVWLKNLNILGDTVTGRSEGGKQLVADLQELLGTIDPASVDVLISAHPIDRRRKEFKWFQSNGTLKDMKTSADHGEALAQILKTECETLGVNISNRAALALIGRVNGNTRLILGEARKLAAYLGSPGGEITEQLILDLVPPFGEGDFFEVAEAFFSLDLAWTLDAIRRHFFIHSEARPLISNLQNRNRLMIQLRVLIDSGELRPGPRGFAKADFDRATQLHARHFGGSEEKNSFNVFTQNLWYLGNKIAPGMKSLNLRRLINFQIAFAEAFTDLLDRPKEQEAVMRDLAIRCLS